MRIQCDSSHGRKVRGDKTGSRATGNRHNYSGLESQSPLGAVDAIVKGKVTRIERHGPETRTRRVTRTPTSLQVALAAKPRALPDVPVALSVLLGPRATSKLTACHAAAGIPAISSYAEQRLKPPLSLRPITPGPQSRCSERDSHRRFTVS